ncbi:hypothetical protein SAMN05216349_108128 [Oribacterium sp. KHPX15]|uniref:hypothetical protein n=1 Tax=Oribacterium sp. KHPX15 TaxID=1855342 RepID=UPI00089AAA45|nr:hypothetical protein [Oribacterium sp. KHPX15]SEA29365.1 hypothetical protein SAMN05216349_108128 [Oribacterium sp. KHPX15]
MNDNINKNDTNDPGLIDQNTNDTIINDISSENRNWKKATMAVIGGAVGILISAVAFAVSIKEGKEPEYVTKGKWGDWELRKKNNDSDI